MGLPQLPFNTSPPQLIVTDIGANPVAVRKPSSCCSTPIGLKQLLYGPIAGPPRNSAQIGHARMTGTRAR